MEESIQALERELYSQSSDSSDWPLVPDHETRPCYVCNDGSIYVEMWHTGNDSTAVLSDSDRIKRVDLSRIATSFIIRFAEPQSRTEFMHHYKLTSYSVLAGLSLRDYDILPTLQRLSKNVVPKSVAQFVRALMCTFGRVNLVLRRGRVFVESQSTSVLLKLLENETIRTSRIDVGSSIASDTCRIVTTTSTENTTVSIAKRKREEERKRYLLDNIDHIEELYEEEENEGSRKRTRNDSAPVASFEIEPRSSSIVKQIAAQMGYPMLEEYDYTKDNLNPNLDMRLKTSTQLRHYQTKALAMMFMRSRARSGTIVLPCGAGKTLTGIAAACTIGKGTIVMCSNTVACRQWIQQFMFYTDIHPRSLIEFTAGQKIALPPDGSAVVLATTYAMMSMRDDRRAAFSLDVMKQIRSREWGLLILDEVHMAPVDNFRLALNEVKTHCKLGLTATLVREDNQVGDLNFLVGPKLFEADWAQLTNEGFLARVICAEVSCPMSPSYMRAYLYEQSEAKRDLLCVMNPIKFKVCETLMRRHEDMGDKVLIYTDSVVSVREYGIRLGRYYMFGSTSNSEREELLRRFRMTPREGEVYPNQTGPINTLILSKIGDVAIDLPEANVLIQVSSHCGSRRQEAQRLGRILRPKKDTYSDQNRAIFYSLISLDTTEAGVHKDNRREYVQQQGYSYKTVTLDMLDLPPYEEDESVERANIKALLASKDLMKQDEA